MLFKSISHLFHLSIEFSDDIFFLRIFQFLKLWYDLINNCFNLTIVVINLFFFYMPLLARYFIVFICFICYTNYLFLDHSYFEIFLKFVNFLAIILFSLNKPILSSSNVVLNFIVFIIYFLFFLNDGSKALIPVTGL